MLITSLYKTFNNDKKTVIANIFNLSYIQIVNQFLPLVTIPYLVRVLGPEKFGLLAFIQSFVSYFSILVDYGFAFSATRSISIYRENREKISGIFCSVLLIKLMLTALCAGVFLCLVFSIPIFKPVWFVYLFAFSGLIGGALFPGWFFSGIEKMKYLTLFNVISQFIFTCSIFIFIRRQEDYIYLPMIGSAIAIVSGIMSLYIAKTKFKIIFSLPALSDIMYELKEGWHVFASSVAITLYTTSNPFIIGLFAGNVMVGYYSAAQGLIGTAQNLLVPLTQSIYPYVSKLAYEARDRAVLFIKRIAFLAGGAAFIISITLFIFAGPIATFMLGPLYIRSIPVLKVLSFLPFIIILSNIFAVQGLYAFRYQHAVARFVIPVAIVHFLLLLIIVRINPLIGTAALTIFTEILITVFSIYYFEKVVVKHQRI